jgi:hypothetical protein
MLRKGLAPPVSSKPSQALHQGHARHEHDEEADQADDPVRRENDREQQQTCNEGDGRSPGVAGGLARVGRHAQDTSQPSLVL